MACMATRTGSFEYVHTPKHDPWLNLAESTISKMHRSCLRHIRLTALDELPQDILKGIDEMNTHSVRFQWKNFATGRLKRKFKRYFPTSASLQKHTL